MAGQQYAAAEQAYQQALARYNNQRQGLLTNYGYAGSIDPKTGLVTKVHVDNTNTTGQYQQLLHNQYGEDENALYGMEDRGIFGGLANQAQSGLRFQHEGQDSSLMNALLGNLSDIDSQQLTAKQQLDQELWQLQEQAALDAIQQGDYNPGGDGSGDSGGNSNNNNTSSSKTAAATHAAQVTKALAVAKKVIPTKAQSQVGKKTTVQKRGA
jgi:hypothetical protein